MLRFSILRFLMSLQNYYLTTKNTEMFSNIGSDMPPVGGVRCLADQCIIRVLFPKLETLFISTWEEAGPRLFIQHGFATMISAKKIGANCHINQQVTIGFTLSDEPPTIGDHVSIYYGAKVLGKISIGNNVAIGANAVVIKDVESDVVVGGVPARIIRHL